MATKRRLKTSQTQDVGEVSPRASLRLRSKGEREDQQTSAGMSLDVLAQVASETLENEPDSPKKITPRKDCKNGVMKSPGLQVSMRTIQTLKVLDLEHVLGLTEKNLINLFSDVEFNEMRRNFTYTCYLMPRTCQKQFTSFGSEMRAYRQIKKHLYQHLDELKAEANAPSRKTKFKFTAEPVQIRKKRVYELLVQGTKKKSAKPGNFNVQLLNSCKDLPSVALKTNQSDNNTKDTGTGWAVSYDDIFGDSDVSDETVAKLRKRAGRKGSQTVVGRHVPVVHNIEMDKPSELDSDTERSLKSEATEKRIEENEQFIIDLLSKTQPHHDHSYTTVFGQRKGAEVIHHLMEDSDEEKVDTPSGNTVIYLDKKGNITKKQAKPILFLRHRSPNVNVPMVSKEEIITEHDGESDGEDDELTKLLQNAPYLSEPGKRPHYLDMFKKKLTYYKVGPLNALQDPMSPEDMIVKKKKKLSSSSVVPKQGKEKEGNKRNQEVELNTADTTSRSSKGPMVPVLNQKLALKLIKELKVKKKNENIPLVCKICKDKTFTATATLMYHYRSHAGIKPFVCLICRTTFTRQHSLNYHMLIHNNQSRFTCKDCGRKFRHPSHYKEHLRRHTGETPFECSDCGQKFKTRNTYKRHLKTRHGKLLTADGISQMSREEFLKVRTKPYRIPRNQDVDIKYPIRKPSWGRRRRGQVDSEEPVDVGVMLKSVDEIKREVEVKVEVESDSETESARSESAGDESLNNSREQEIPGKHAVFKDKDAHDNASDFLESICSEILAGNNGEPGPPKREFEEVTPKVTKSKKRRGNISIEIVEGGQKLSVTNNIDSAAASTDGKTAEETECSDVSVDNIRICVPMKMPVSSR